MASDTDRSGFVYVIQDASGLVKIGRTKDIEKRLRALSTGASSTLSVVTYWSCEDAAEREAIEHEFWSEYRVRGEWFCIPDHILNIWREFSGSHMPSEDNEDAWFEMIHGSREMPL